MGQALRVVADAAPFTRSGESYQFPFDLPDVAGEHFLYRLYDRSNSLIYAGITGPSLRERLIGHARAQWWWDKVARCEADPHKSRRAAQWAEWDLITEARPEYNKQANRPSFPVGPDLPVVPARHRVEAEETQS